MIYRADIDGLRALAVLAVIFYHASIPFCGGGYAGVDVFFVISGFLITGLLRRETAEGRFTLGSFYERRARRILPALALVAAACVPLVIVLRSREPALDFFHLLLLTSIFAGNFGFLDGAGPYTPVNPLEHTWSLALEEQFYLFFPLLVLWLGKKDGTLLKAVAGLGLLSLLLCLASGFGANPGAYYQLPYRAWELMAGALLALAPAYSGTKDLREAASVTGFACIVVSFIILSRDAPFSLLAAALPCLGTLALLWAGGTETDPPHLSRLLASPLPAGIGRISYSLYLWHWPMLLVFARGGHINLHQKAFAALLTFFLAFLSYFYVETPVRQKKVFRTGKAVTLFSVGTTLTLAAAALAGMWLEGK